MKRFKKSYKQYLENDPVCSDVAPRTVNRWRKKFRFEESRLSQGDVTLTDESNADLPVQETNDHHNDIIINEDSVLSTQDECIQTEANGNQIESTLESHKNNSSTQNDPIETEEDVYDEEIIFQETGAKAVDILTMVYALQIKHHLTNEARNDILAMIKLLANVDGNKLPSTNYHVNKYFQKDNDLKYIFYCKSCKSKLCQKNGRDKVEVEIVRCPIVACQAENIVSLQSENVLIIVNPAEQIKAVLDTKLPNDYTNNDNYNGTIHDIHDGKIHQKLREKVDFDMTYNFSTDGAPIFASSKLGMWPLQLTLNGLPPEIRFKYLIFVGIWVGKGEPNVYLMNTFMDAFVTEAEKLYEPGLILTNKKCIKLLPLTCIVDSVARPILQNRRQFNGYFGCSWCYHPGNIVKKQVKYLMRAENIENRTHESHMRNLQEVISKDFKEVQCGVKGPTPLIKLRYFDMIWGFPVDCMHSVYLGVTRQLWELWTTYSPESKRTYYIGTPQSLKKINDRLLSIKPPQEIHRLPRSIVAERAKWKASEWRSWLLFYSLPCLEGILVQPYLAHYTRLVKSIYFLLQENITERNISKAEKSIQQFVEETEEYYGQSAMTFNMHSLLHIVESVRCTGPLWATSTSPFESGIFKIKQQVKGPVGVAKQICKKMPKIRLFLLEIQENSNLLQFSKNFTLNLFQLEKLKIVNKSDEVTFLGSGAMLTKDQTYFKQICNICMEHAMNTSDLILFKRCFYKKSLLHSTDYTKAKKTNDTIIKLNSGEFARIIKLISYRNQNVMLIKILPVIRLRISNISMNHIFEIIDEDKGYHCLPISHYQEKCSIIEINDSKKYILKLPNTCEVQ